MSSIDISEDMALYLRLNLADEVREKLPDSSTMRELLLCLAEFVIEEFTKDTMNAKNKVTSNVPESDEDKVSAFLDDLDKLG